MFLNLCKVNQDIANIISSDVEWALVGRQAGILNSYKYRNTIGGFHY
jgi:hypothetical protein